jgi:teichuronic acid biosynthesis glycosyltransferase TuaG
MTTPLVSIIMPSYNAGRFITEAIESVQAQTYPQWELIVVNDGSTDNTDEIVQPFVRKDQRVKLVAQSNGRQAKARNTGIRQATGEWIAFLDADDSWLPDKLEKQFREIQEIEADLFFSEAYLVDPMEHRIGVMGAGQGFFYAEQGLKQFLEKNQVPILTVMLRKSWLLHCGLFDENPAIQTAEDYELWLRLLLLDGRLYGSKEITANYTLNPAASTAADRSAFFAVSATLLQLSKKFPAAQSQILQALATKTIRWLQQNPGNKNQLLKAAKMYFEAHGEPVSKLSEWLSSPASLHKKVVKHFERHYA